MDHSTIDICMFYDSYNANVSCNSSMNNTIRMGNSTNRYTFLLTIVDKITQMNARTHTHTFDIVRLGSQHLRLKNMFKSTDIEMKR